MSDKYLELLAKDFPTKQAVVTELINLNAILNLPKGTEHFVSDIHGEYEAFQHILKNGSGRIKRKIAATFNNTLSVEEQNDLAFLIYYPVEKIKKIRDKLETTTALRAWHAQQLHYLIAITKEVASKYTRSKVRKAISPEYSYIIEELLFSSTEQKSMSNYYKEIITTIIELGSAESFIIELSQLIQDLTIDHLHVVGDIYDRGPAPVKIIDELMNYHSVDIQWGNHDILWMGAALGSLACQANVLRICARYNNLDILEHNYGISLRTIADFAKRTYPEPAATFYPKIEPESTLSFAEQKELAAMQQAIAIIQFKLEGQLITENPDFKMSERNHLEKITYLDNIYHGDKSDYPLNIKDFITVNPAEPNQLTAGEQQLIEQLNDSFKQSEKLQRHISFLIEKGSMYLVYNQNLLFHGCLPLDESGEFETIYWQSEELKGKTLLDYFDKKINQVLRNTENNIPSKNEDLAAIWYLWSGEKSPLFGKDKMTTFERYFITDKATHIEIKNPYYYLRENLETCEQILKEFNLETARSRIINGHTPVKERKGENPIKAEGKLIVIDGGFSKPYQKTTGRAGYTLLFNSYGMDLAVHNAFNGKRKTVESEQDLTSDHRLVYKQTQRILVADTDIGNDIKKQQQDLYLLLNAFKTGFIKEN